MSFTRVIRLILALVNRLQSLPKILERPYLLQLNCILFTERALSVKDILNETEPTSAPPKQCCAQYIGRCCTIKRMTFKRYHSYVTVVKHCTRERGRKAKIVVRNLQNISTFLARTENEYIDINFCQLMHNLTHS